MSSTDLIITKAANIVHFGRVHAAERDLKVWYATTDYTAESQRPLCRPNNALGRYGVQITKAAVTCANCARIIAKAEAEAHIMNAAIDAVEAAGSLAVAAGVEVVPTVKLTPAQAEAMHTVAFRTISSKHSRYLSDVERNGGVLIRFGKNSRIATLRALAKLDLIEQTADGERGHYGSTGSCYVKLTEAGMAWCEAKLADRLAYWREQYGAEAMAERYERQQRAVRVSWPVGLHGEAEAEARAQMQQWSRWYRRHDTAGNATDAARMAADEAEAHELDAERDALAPMSPETAQHTAWVESHQARGTWDGMTAAIELDHADALAMEQARVHTLRHIGTWRQSCYEAGCTGCPLTGARLDALHSEAIKMDEIRSYSTPAAQAARKLAVMIRGAVVTVERDGGEPVWVLTWPGTSSPEHWVGSVEHWLNVKFIGAAMFTQGDGYALHLMAGDKPDYVVARFVNNPDYRATKAPTAREELDAAIAAYWDAPHRSETQLDAVLKAAARMATHELVMGHVNGVRMAASCNCGGWSGKFASTAEARVAWFRHRSAVIG